MYLERSESRRTHPPLKSKSGPNQKNLEVFVRRAGRSDQFRDVVDSQVLIVDNSFQWCNCRTESCGCCSQAGYDCCLLSAGSVFCFPVLVVMVMPMCCGTDESRKDFVCCGICRSRYPPGFLPERFSKGRVVIGVESKRVKLRASRIPECPCCGVFTDPESGLLEARAAFLLQKSPTDYIELCMYSVHVVNGTRHVHKIATLPPSGQISLENARNFINEVLRGQNEGWGEVEELLADDRVWLSTMHVVDGSHINLLLQLPQPGAEDANPCKSDRLPTLSMSPPAPGGEHGNFEDWSTTEVMQWLERISMAHLVECFVSSHITGKVLSLMTKDELYGMMEGHPLGDKILLWHRVLDLRQHQGQQEDVEEKVPVEKL